MTRPGEFGGITRSGDGRTGVNRPDSNATAHPPTGDGDGPLLRPMLIYGMLAGGLNVVITLVALALFGTEHLGNSELFGYLVMLLALSVVFVGIKRYRDRALGGVIRFGTAAALGLGITVVASVIYVAAWEVNLAMNDGEFVESYTTALIAEREAEGMSGEELEAEMEEMERMAERYADPRFRLPITFMEIFPVGLLVTLASAGLLRDPGVLPARA